VALQIVERKNMVGELAIEEKTIFEEKSLTMYNDHYNKSKTKL